MATINDPDDRSSDVHVPLDPARFAIARDIEEVQVPNSVLDTGLVDGVKIAAEHTKQDSSPLLSSSRGASLSTSPDQVSDAASVHSMPAVHISEPTPSDPQRPSTASPGLSAPQLPSRPVSAVPPTSPPTPQLESSTLSQQQRRARHRSAIEVRSSNRLSGFFNSLIHRRDGPPNPSVREAIDEDQSATKLSTDKTSRSSSPSPAPTVTPPPPLPPPTLQELGLSLSALTADLTPAHFTTPPTSGTFLAPHYLLLCHAQGLDVLPLVSPPAPQPYALVRRVAFKSAVVMEHRGVLVAIAGRRDGVRVYALEEVKKAIEWRMDVEIRRERERLRREAAKKNAMRSESDMRDSAEKVRKASLSTPPPMVNLNSHVIRKSSHGNLPSIPSSPPPLIPRAPRTPTRKSRLPSLRVPPPIPQESPLDQPPPYPSPTDPQPPPLLRSQPSALSVRARARSNSVSNVLAGVSVLARNGESSRLREANSKSDDWAGSSDDEAIDIRAAASGSQALDERTSATLSANRDTSGVVAQANTRPRASTNSSRRRRPSNLDFSAIRNTTVPDPEPSPAPTLLTLRQALQQLPPSACTPDTFDDADDDDDETDGRISLAQALLESRLPDLPPPGSVQPQEPILLSATHLISQDSSNPQSLEANGSIDKQETAGQLTRRRRWSVMLAGSSISTRNQSQNPASSPHNILQSNFLSPSASNNQINGHFTRSPSFRSNTIPTPIVQSPLSAGPSLTAVTSPCTSTATSVLTPTNPAAPRSSRFIPRIISNALNRRSDERLPSPMSTTDAELGKWLNGPPLAPPAPPPKLEYVKLPGTKGALMIKAVETQKKSFLAILCGENGEKVELFAGTYRTALGLSRTFILPDSPRSLELQLQGDDLVEVFLVFSQNVFGLEPATVRVREVRIGRAERRAARRRARENRVGEATASGSGADEDEANVNVTIGVSVAVSSTAMATENGPDRPPTPPLIANEHPDAPSEEPRTPNQELLPTNTTGQPEELLAVATAQMGSYTTFQQLSFAPNFPLASIADEYIIPPTYPNFLGHCPNHVQEDNSDETESSQTQFSPPGLPVPIPLGPTQWYYKDPKGIMHGPWNSALMQAWYRDGLLPADLPVRREGESDYTLLKDLKMQCVDPAHPFRSPPPLLANIGGVAHPAPNPAPSTKEELLPPISLLAQPKHFGPPALFFSSRGGHSTAVVDARGRSVLKSRFIWSNDDPQDDPKTLASKMGDVKRLEALDVRDRSVLVAMRQGGLEAVDLGDALLRPADQSRTVLPSFSPPSNTINRRPPFVWKIGTPVNSSNTASAALSTKGKSSLASLPKRSAIGITKSTISSQGSVGADFEGDPTEEVLFFGRKVDEIYFCERNAGSFRILKLGPDTNE